ncbi:OmpA family protein [Pseudoprimorskyibacter insulae]|uniref:Putative lipoprotein YiaD n=1 Tax=Pseudoprimorskyibacter insulae TaxID=1695997 RepID=A0A2R8ATN8_9RHOB|nr:OmpA family protein [Pseudoprimorskyibacter insulae]SPF79411.1 putative lipoprotein YiaD [Pseudoprimorskyibacter insulae]
MIRARIPLTVVTLSVLTLTACSQPAYQPNPQPATKTQKGALLGGAIGGLLGAMSGDNGAEKRQNAIKGAIIGAAGGAIIGNQLDKQEADLRNQLGNDNVTIQNTGDRLIVTMPQDILFATDSATLRPDLTRDLRTVAQNLIAYPDTTVQVIGHTDNTGDATYNQNLSVSRARSVANVLVGEGVQSYRVQAFGRGESQPVASNLTPEGRQQNRRVEIVILPNA